MSKARAVECMVDEYGGVVGVRGPRPREHGAGWMQATPHHGAVAWCGGGIAVCFIHWSFTTRVPGKTRVAGKTDAS